MKFGVGKGMKAVLVAALLALVGLGTSVTAQEAGAQVASAPTAGLGSAWPNAQDVSRQPQWHVYVFMRDGVKYIQVNDTNGVVRGGIAASVSGDTRIALPLGLGQVAVVPDGVAPVQGTVVYSDANTVVSSTSSGLVASPQLMSAADCTSVPDCSKLNN